MSSAIVFLFVAFMFLIGIEFLFLGAFRGSPSTQKKSLIRAVCRVILGTLIAAYILLVGFFLYVGADMILSGKTGQGVSVLVSGAIIGVCVYFWLIRGWIRHMKQAENHQ